MRQVALAEVKDDLSRFLRLAESEEIVITRHGKPAGVLVGFESEEDWFDYRLEHDPRFSKPGCASARGVSGRTRRSVGGPSAVIGAAVMAVSPRAAPG